jgi:hypothetical protein
LLSIALWIPMLANSIGPQSSAASISIIIASRHSARSRSGFGSVMMNFAASYSVRADAPLGKGMG